MTTTTATGSVLRTARRWFWALTIVAILLVGALSWELTAPSRPLVGMAVAGTGILLAVVVTQASRLMIAIGRATLPRSPARDRRPRRGH